MASHDYFKEEESPAASERARRRDERMQARERQHAEASPSHLQDDRPIAQSVIPFRTIVVCLGVICVVLLAILVARCALSSGPSQTADTQQANVSGVAGAGIDASTSTQAGAVESVPEDAPAQADGPSVDSTSSPSDGATESDAPETEYDPALPAISVIAASGTAGSTFTSNGGLSFIAPAAGIVPPAGYQGVEDPWVTSGRYSTGDPELDGYIKEFCDSHTSSDMDYSDNAYYTYLPAAWAEYAERDDNQDPAGPAWMYAYAKQYWANQGGNCYEFAAFVAFLLQYFGYDDAYPQPCIVALQSGAWGDHGLVFVTNHDGVASLCDTALGSNGWMLPQTAYTYTIKEIGQPDLVTANAARFSS